MSKNNDFNFLYDNKLRFISYWHQIDEVLKVSPKITLEIGIGNSFVSNYLKKAGLNIITLDINEKLSPRVVGNIFNIPFKDASFDVVACFEIFEHLPYENFQKELLEVFRVSKNFVLLSLPDMERIYCFYLRIPKLIEFKKMLSLPRINKPVHTFDGQHYWEIGKATWPLKRIVKDIQKAGFEIMRTYRIFEFPYHRFFILRKH